MELFISQHKMNKKEQIFASNEKKQTN